MKNLFFIFLFSAFIFGRLYAAGVPAPYDEQWGLTYVDNFTAIAYNVTAVAQTDLSGIGPAYLVNGYSNTGYWYQIGLTYDWVVNSTYHNTGYEPIFAIFLPNGTSITSTTAFTFQNGQVYSGDKVLLDLYFKNNDVILLLKDWNTGAYATYNYTAAGATTFVGNPYSTATNGYFTGLMTEWYHTSAYYENGQEVLYAPYGGSGGEAWLWMDEFYCNDYPQCFSKTNLFDNQTSQPIYGSYTLSSENAAEEYFSDGEFLTGAVPTTTTSVPYYSTEYTTSIQSTTTTPPVIISQPTTIYSTTTVATSTTTIPITTVAQSNNQITNSTNIFSNFLSAIISFFASLFGSSSTPTTSTINSTTTIFPTSISTSISTTVSSSTSTTSVQTTTIPSCSYGYVYGTDGLCHPECGNSGNYCTGDSSCYNNNQCLSCQSGYVLGSDGLCHQECGNSGNYCTNGATCYNGQCLSCPYGGYLGTDGQCHTTVTETCSSGYVLGSDNLCHPECGNSGTYCTGSAECYNSQCLSCPSGYYLATNGECYPYS